MPADIEAGSTHTGSVEALFQLGLMYSAGRGVPRDYVIAHKWFNIAALKGNKAARRYRSELAEEMTKSEVAEAQRQAREWLTRH
jgi:TPR repeat protein